MDTVNSTECVILSANYSFVGVFCKTLMMVGGIKKMGWQIHIRWATEELGTARPLNTAMEKLQPCLNSIFF